MDKLEVKVRNKKGYKIKLEIEGQTVNEVFKKLEFMMDYFDKHGYVPFDQFDPHESKEPKPETFVITQINYSGLTKSRQPDHFWRVLSAPFDGFGEHGIAMYREQWAESGLEMPKPDEDLTKYVGWLCHHNGRKVTKIYPKPTE